MAGPPRIAHHVRLTMPDVPAEAERLLSVPAAEFVAERQRLARELRQAGRSEEAAAVAGIRKPSQVVLAVNRAARDRPAAARDAADAALEVRKAQVGADPPTFERAVRDLEKALELLAEVATAHVAPAGKRPSDAMRRRVQDVLRNAVADEDAREALRRGALTEEPETPGFATFAGVTPKRAAGRKSAPSADARTLRRRERARALENELKRAERDLAEAERAVERAERERRKAERVVAATRKQLDRLRAD